jgi:hypothetical protein
LFFLLVQRIFILLSLFIALLLQLSNITLQLRNAAERSLLLLARTPRGPMLLILVAIEFVLRLTSFLLSIGQSLLQRDLLTGVLVQNLALGLLQYQDLSFSIGNALTGFLLDGD